LRVSGYLPNDGGEDIQGKSRRKLRGRGETALSYLNYD
jgi:hypothetical protein